MAIPRRTFLRSVALKAASLGPASRLLGQASEAAQGTPPQRFDPWVEVIPSNLGHNVATLRRLGGRPILAVIKNHGYGLDYRVVVV